MRVHFPKIRLRVHLSFTREYFSQLIGVPELVLDHIIHLQGPGGVSLINVNLIILAAGYQLDGFADVTETLGFGDPGVTGDVLVEVNARPG